MRETLRIIRRDLLVVLRHAEADVALSTEQGFSL
jgi:hypothetical protein